MAIQTNLMGGIGEAGPTYATFIITFIAITTITTIIARAYKTRTLVWFALFSLANVLYGIVELASICTGEHLWKNLAYSTITGFWFFCWMMFFTASTQTRASPILVPCLVALITFLHAIAWFPDLGLIDVSFIIGNYALPLLVASMFMYWAGFTLASAPLFARKAAVWLFISSILLTVSNMLIQEIPHEAMIAFDAAFGTIITAVILKHPGILAFVPYKAQHLILLDKRGGFVLEQSWSTKKGAYPKGPVLDRNNVIALLREIDALGHHALRGAQVIELEIANVIMLIRTGSRHFIAGLITKHSSQALREGFSLLMEHVDGIKDKETTGLGGSFENRVVDLFKTRLLNIHAFR